MATDNRYGQQKVARQGQSGPSYPSLKGDNPLQAVRDTYRMPQEDAYKMQPGRFMPAIDPTLRQMGITDRRATIGESDFHPAERISDKRMNMNPAGLDTNLRMQWIEAGEIEEAEGRK